MKILIALSLILSSCYSTGTRPEANDMDLPECRMIYIGNCKHIWCEKYQRGGMDRVDPACIPTDAVVSDHATGH